MGPLTFLSWTLLFLICLLPLSFAQCVSPELVKGADKYNELVCKGIAASRIGNNNDALHYFLTASEQPVLESPNILLFGRIALAYAHLGEFQKADLYLRYDDISLRWLIGIVRCQAQPDSNDENLVQDGETLKSDEAKHMANVLCGPIFDNDSYFGDRDAESFVPAAKAILRYDEIHKEIDGMRDKRHLNQRRR